jgi:hypothetical protein
VLHPIGELEVVDEDVPVVLLRQRAVEDLLLLGHRLLDVVEEGLLVDRPGHRRPGVDHPAAGLELAVLAGEVLDEARRGGDVEAGGEALGVEVERREVELDLGVERLQLELADPVHLHQRVEGEGEVRPVAPLPHLQGQVVAGDLDAQALAVRRDRQGHRDLEVLGLGLGVEELVGHLLDLGLDGPLVVHQLDHLDGEVAAPLGLEEELGGEVEGLADARREVRDAEAGEELAVLEPLGREGDGDAHHPHPLAGAAEELPEGVAVLVVDRDRPRYRQHARGGDPRADAGDDPQHHRHGARHGRAQAEELEQQQEQQRHRHAGDQAEQQAVVLAEEDGLVSLLGRGEGGPVDLGVPLEEVEDAVPPRVEAGREGGPGDRRLRRDGRPQRREAPLSPQLREVRQLPLVHPLLGELGVGAVEAEDDQLPGRLRGERRRGERQKDAEDGEQGSDLRSRLQGHNRRIPGIERFKG